MRGTRGTRSAFSFRSALPADKPCAVGHDNGIPDTYISGMRSFYILLPLLGLLAVALWFAGTGWAHLGGVTIPPYGWAAIIGGVTLSLLVGGGLMALVFYSSRHGYDDLDGGDGKR
jgi:hypothetical protein